MLEIITILSTVAPGVVSILGIITTLILAGVKLVNAIKQFSTDKDQLLKELAASDSAWKSRVEQLIEQNEQLAEANRLLTDHLAHIKGYSAAKIAEKKEK